MNKTTTQNKYYDVIVVGAGHAGCEAAHAAAKMGAAVLMVSMKPELAAPLPCNPSVGGPGKGHLVREIGALGGLMAEVADSAAIQIKELNTSKGPAVRAYRAQIDKPLYNKNMIKKLRSTPNLEILGDEVKQVVANSNKIVGVLTAKHGTIGASAVIICGGTFLNGEIVIGNRIIRKGGRIDAKAANGLTESLTLFGLENGRLKTGTPPRIARDSIDYNKMSIAPGSEGKISFSYPDTDLFTNRAQVPCYLTYTNNKTHQIILDHISQSPVFSGLITERSPRSCPSIELKVANFPDKSRHPIFVEPIGGVDGPEGDRMYLQGCSTAFDEAMQERFIHSIRGLEKAKFLAYGYAVVYDFFLPHQLKTSLETKKIDGLYMAGQMNGTTGYEEAAAQGLVAGINAVRKIRYQEPFILSRAESYIGVLIDDLVTKIHVEPYRIFTSRAEYRLLLRNDNADLRLSKYGYELGLISKQQYRRVEQKISQIKSLTQDLKKQKFEYRGKLTNAYGLLKRPEVDDVIITTITNKAYDYEVLHQVELEAKYGGYFEKQRRAYERMQARLSAKIADSINYDSINGLRNEARLRLKEVQPNNLAQASRIQGVTPADLSLVAVANHAASKSSS